MPLQGGVSFRNAPTDTMPAGYPSPGSVQPFQSARDFHAPQPPAACKKQLRDLMGRTLLCVAWLTDTCAATNPADYYISIVELQLEGEIGRGAYGVVFQGRHRGVEVAIKQVYKDASKEQCLIFFTPLVGC